MMSSSKRRTSTIWKWGKDQVTRRERSQPSDSPRGRADIKTADLVPDPRLIKNICQGRSSRRKPRTSAVAVEVPGVRNDPLPGLEARREHPGDPAVVQKNDDMIAAKAGVPLEEGVRKYKTSEAI